MTAPEDVIAVGVLIHDGQDEGFRQVVAQLTKNLIDGTWTRSRRDKN